MSNSYFLLPEAFDSEEILYAAIDGLHDVDAIWLPGDFPEECSIPEDVFVTILANYGQVRKYFHTKAFGRGYRRPPPPRPGASKPGPKANTDRTRTSGSSSAGQNRRPMNTGAPRRFSKRNFIPALYVRGADKMAAGRVHARIHRTNLPSGELRTSRVRSATFRSAQASAYSTTTMKLRKQRTQTLRTIIIKVLSSWQPLQPRYFLCQPSLASPYPQIADWLTQEHSMESSARSNTTELSSFC